LFDPLPPFFVSVHSKGDEVVWHEARIGAFTSAYFSELPARMKAICKKIFLCASFTILLAAANVMARPGGDGIRNIDVPGSGHIMFGPLEGQLTPQAAIGKVLHVVGQHCGDRPQITSILKANNGDILAAFFTVTAKNQDGHHLAGLVIASAPKGSPAGAVLLYDDADRFPSSLNPLFQRLKQELAAPSSSPGSSSASSSRSALPSPSGSSSSLPAPTAPAAPLQTFRFPDGTGSIGLPAGWNVTAAQKADILAKGPNGEVLRFGMFVSIVDPRNPQSRALGPVSNGTGPGAFLAIPFGIDGAAAFKAATAQLAIKNRKHPADINIGKVQQVPTSGGGRIFLFSGDVDSHDGQGPVLFISRVVMSASMAVGTWSMTIYQVNVPKPLYPQEANTIAHIFSSYNVNVGAMMGIIHEEMREVQQITNDFIDWSNKLTESGDRMTAGFSDFLREQTVVRDTQNHDAHIRTNDYAAQLLIDSGRFERVPVSEYIKGIDF